MALMINPVRISTLAAWAGVLLVVGAPSCARGPEVFCESWADQTCQAAAVCCQAGTRFDADSCKLALTGSCQDSLDIPRIHAGEVVFDSDAANTCFGATSCAGLQKTEDVSFDHIAACANVTTGFRRPGTGCNAPADCAKAGTYPTCFHGISGGAMGVCAGVVLSDDGNCGFSFDTNELRACPDGSFCDTSKFKPDPNTPPSAVSHEFVAPCHKDPGKGASCFDTSKQSIVVCAQGLFCDFNSPDPTCTELKGKGKSCSGDSECAAGLGCVSDSTMSTTVCGDPHVAFCFSPSKCGDQICEGSETPLTCPEDCGNGGMCRNPGDACDPSLPGQCCPGFGCNPMTFACQ